MSYETYVAGRSGLVLYLPFTETAGTVWTDVTLHGHDATALTGQSVAGAYTGPMGDPAVQLDDPTLSAPGSMLSIAGFATVPHPGGYTSDPFSIEFWLAFQPSGGSSSNAVSLYFQNDAGLGSGATFWVSNLGGAIGVQFGNGDGFSGNLSDTPDNLGFVSCWHLYSVTWDGATSLFYHDGTPWATALSENIAAFPFVPTALLIQTGAWQYKYLQHLAVYDRALSSGEVAAGYAAATPRTDGACFGITPGHHLHAQVQLLD